MRRLRLSRFQKQGHDLGTQTHIRYRAEMARPQAPLAIDQHQAGRALQIIGGHGLRRHHAAVGLGINSHRKPAPLLRQPARQSRFIRLLLMVFEHAVHAHDHHFARGERLQTVHLFDPLATDGRTARFNPLSHIDRGSPVGVLDELQRIAGMLFPAHSHADPFWAEAARTGFIGVGAYVAATPDLPFTLGEIYRQLTDGDPRDRLPKLLEQRRKDGDPLSAGAVSALNDFCSSGENTFASVRQSITTRMGLWLNPLVDAATSASDFDLRAIRSGRLSLYLTASPENMDRVAPLYALLFQQLVDLNSRALPAAGDPQTLVLLDEFARLGRAPVLAHAFAWVAG